MNVVVTGGTGLIGVSLCKALLREGHQVTVITRSFKKAERRLPAGCHIEEWDGKNKGPWEAAVAGAQVIVNLAGENLAAGRWTQAQQRMIVESRLDATRAVVRAVGERSPNQPPPLLISASGKDFYGNTGDATIDERAAAGDSFLASTCAAWEEAAREASTFGAQVVTMRLGLVLAPGGALDRMVLPYQFFVGGPVGGGRQWMSWIHRTDVIRLIFFLMDLSKTSGDDLSGPINAVAPEPVTMKQFGHTIGRVLGRPSWMPVPAFALRMALGEMADLMLHGQRVVPKRALHMGFSFQYPDLTSALENVLRTRKGVR